MKFTKRLLTIALSMGMVMPLCATAYAAPTVTINSATIKANATDSSLYDVTVTFSVADSSKQMSLLLTGPNADNKLDDNDIVHINQFGKDVSGEENYFSGSATCNFSVSKTRMTNAGVTVDNDTGAIDGLWLSMNTDDAVDENAPSVAVTQVVPVTGVTLNKGNLGLVVGGAETLTATLTPSNATSQIAWVSSDTEVATVDTTGTVTAVAEGDATITAFIDTNGDGVLDEDETIRDTCAVTVTAAPAFVKGDANGDGEVDFADAIVVLRHDAGLATITGDNLIAADANGDGEVDFADAILILRYDSGLISSFN